MSDEAKRPGRFAPFSKPGCRTARAAGTALQRVRHQVAFERFLARMFSKGPKADYTWVLNAGYALELRTHSARTTKDIETM